MYIAFEGLDGSGKTKQAVKLYERLKFLNKPTILTREPGSPHISLKVRDFLLSHAEVDGRALELLFQADRAEHTAWVKKMLDQGFWVVSDRCYSSGLAYAQSWGHSLQQLLQINEFSIAVKPDIIVYLDVSAETSVERSRAKNSNTREESRGLEVLKQIRENFLSQIANSGSQKFCRVDSQMWSEDESAEYINRVLGIGVNEVGLPKD